MPDDHEATVQRITKAMTFHPPEAMAAVYFAGARIAARSGAVADVLAAMDTAASAFERIDKCRADAMASAALEMSGAVATAD